MPHLHNCYFHDHNTITHFCTKPECTLPMCEKCLPIHLQEHSTANQGEGIITFGEAEDRAIKGLKGLLAGQAALKTQFVIKIEDIRGRIIQAISELFTKAKNQVEQECACVAEIQKKLTKIQKGSLKTLIYFFTEQQKSINKSTLQLKISQLEQIEKSLMSVMSGETRSEMNQELYHRVQSYEHQGRQRGFSTDTVVKRVEIVRSSSQQKIENTQVHSHNHRTFENEAHLKLRTEASFKALPTINAFQPSDHKYSAQASKLDSESERQKEIQSIRVREEQKQKQRERDQKAEIQRKEKERIDREREAERDRERQMEKERKEREVVLMRVQQHRTTQTQRKNQQFTQMFQKQSNRNYERSSSYTRMESEAVRKPLQISDLNIETKFNAYAKSSAQFHEYENKLPSESLPISKQVLSPEEIRKMLEKRIEERSRLISKNKSATLLKNTEQSITKSYNRSKEVSPGYGQESEGRWDTKDSIINQIYDDYRY